MTVHRPETHYLRVARRITIAGLVDSGGSHSRISDTDVVRSVRSASIDESNSPDNGQLILNSAFVVRPPFRLDPPLRMISE